MDVTRNSSSPHSTVAVRGAHSCQTISRSSLGREEKLWKVDMVVGSCKGSNSGCVVSVVVNGVIERVFRIVVNNS
jgi:hypothetical protein